jgi:hypothetical protein
MHSSPLSMTAMQRTKISVGIIAVGFALLVLARHTVPSLMAWCTGSGVLLLSAGAAIARRDSRQLIRFVAAFLVTLCATFVALSYLAWVEISRHGHRGPGGGFFVALLSLALAATLGFILFCSAEATHYTRSNQNALSEPVAVGRWRGEPLLMLAWLAVLYVSGRYV